MLDFTVMYKLRFVQAFETMLPLIQATGWAGGKEKSVVRINHQNRIS